MKPKMSRALVAQCKESACNARGLGSIPGLGRSPREGKGYPLQYSGLENSMDCIVRGVTKSRTRLSDFHLCWSYLSFLQFASFTISKSPSVVCAFYPWALKSHFHPGYSSVVKNHPLKTKFSYFFLLLIPFKIQTHFHYLSLGLIQPLPTSLFFNFMFFFFFETEQDPKSLPPCPLPAFCLLKSQSKLICLIREMRKCGNKG